MIAPGLPAGTATWHPSVTVRRLPGDDAASPVTAHRPPHADRISPGVALALAAPVAVVGLVCAGYNTFGALMPYADCINGALLFDDVQRTGLRAVADWRLPADNFLLVLHAFAAPWMLAFGTGLASLVIFGTLLLALGAAASGVLVAGATRDWRPAAFAVLLLFAIPLSLAHVNQSHPVGHGSTMIFVLAAAWLAAGMVASGQTALGRSAALAVLTFACTLSDPWFAAACGVPLVVTAVVLALSREVPLRPALAIVTGVVLGTGAAYVALRVARHVGWLQTHPMLFATPEMIAANARSLLEALPLLFNYDAGSLPTLLWWPFVALGVGLALLVMLRVRAAWHALAAPGRFVLLFTAMGCLSVAGAYLLTQFAWFSRGPASARYLLNVYYMAFVAGAVVLATAWPRLGWRKAIVWGWMAIFALPTAYSALRELHYNAFAPNPSLAVHRIVARLLEREGLHDGFAPYATGAVGANSLTYLARGGLTVRPVEVHDGRIRAFVLNANRQWYAPPNDARFLLVERADAATFGPAAEATFGPPATTLVAMDYVIWTWDRNLMPLVARP